MCQGLSHGVMNCLTFFLKEQVVNFSSHKQSYMVLNGLLASLHEIYCGSVLVELPCFVFMKTL